MAELKAGVGQPSVERSNSRSIGNTSIFVSVVGDFVQWNEEAIARCTLLTPQVPFLIFHDLLPCTSVSLGNRHLFMKEPTDLF